MKKLIAMMAVLVLGTSLSAQEGLKPAAKTAAKPGLITVELNIVNVTRTSGPIYAAVFKNAEEFDRSVEAFKQKKRGPGQLIKVEVKDLGVPLTKIKIPLPPGTYGIFIYQDLDQDTWLTQSGSFFTTPDEPYSFSKNFKPSLPPSFHKFSFTIPGEHTVQTIELK